MHEWKKTPFDRLLHTMLLNSEINKEVRIELRHRMAVYMTTFLLRDNVPFIKLFIDKGFDLKLYLTSETLEQLYTLSVYHAKQKALANVIGSIMKLPESISLHLIGKILSFLMGTRYYSEYLNTAFTGTKDTRAKEPLVGCPATHLFLWTLLTERKETAEFFWTQLQEPLGASLMAVLLLRRFAHHTNSLVNRDELLTFAGQFEDRACGLLTECYVDDPENAADLLVRDRPLFGHMSTIMLAADGRSKNFISHRCSEQYLEHVWCGAIDPQTRRLNLFFGLIIGIVMPLLLPFTVKFNPTENKKSDENEEAGENLPPLPPRRKREGNKTPILPSREMRCTQYWHRIKAFYESPCIRFAYTTIAHVAFLCLFVYTILFDVSRQRTYNITYNAVLMCWVVTFLIENIRQGIMSGLSFRSFIRRIWKMLELLAIVLYIIGFAVHLLLVVESLQRNQPLMSATAPAMFQMLFRMAETFYGLSLFLFFYRLLEAFTADMKIGPLVIMVKSMVVKDLLPFLAVFMVSLVSFAVLQWVITFKDTASTSHSMNIRTLFMALQTAYFQIFGEYSLDMLTEEDMESCTSDGINCRDGMSEWFSPILLAVFVILTQVLLLNLLIAMFASTYVRIEAASTGYWELQRYYVICEFFERSPIPPPLIILWHIYLLFRMLLQKCQRRAVHPTHPFKKSFHDWPSRERQLVHWERLRFLDYQRYVLQGRKRRRERPKPVLVRTTLMTGPIPAMNVPTAEAFENFQQVTTENMRQIIQHTNRIDALDHKVGHILKLLKLIQTKLYDIERLKQTQRQTVTQTVQALRSAPPDQTPTSSDSNIKTEKQCKLVVYETDGHKIGLFSPATADNTPSLYASPIPWHDAERVQVTKLKWRPSHACVEGWHEPDDFQAAIAQRLWHPMGSAYIPDPAHLSPDPVTLMPRNPGGCTGVTGKGYLPAWGPNSAIIMILTRQKTSSKAGKKSHTALKHLECAVHENPLGTQLPWFLVQHPQGCAGDSCYQTMVDLLVNKRMEEIKAEQPERSAIYEDALGAYHAATITKIFHGYLNDMINTDNAWIEPVVVRIHFENQTELTDLLLQ
ncbi:unnamed protein product, partial [Dicrocoelium dendriticum]